MKQTLNYLFQGHTLTKEQAKNALISIGKGAVNNSHITAFLTVFMMRTITVEELDGFRTALLELCQKVDLSAYQTIDMCGTGGDGKDTFNISTLASFVVAGAGIKVAKHGNYGVSSGCGSSNVLESLGVVFTNEEAKLQEQIEKAGICFLHAPLFHPAMKHVAPVRKELGLKTFFNMLGPLVNPSFPTYQLVGVYSLEVARLYNYLLQGSTHNYTIVRSLDGYDEVSLTGDFKIITKDGEQLLSPKRIGMQQITQEQLHGGATVEESAKIFMQVLNGNGTDAQNAVVLANAAYGIKTAKGISLEDALATAKKSLQSGAALKALNTLTIQQ
jgi:anthranilate phosphoribosyltransferase